MTPKSDTRAATKAKPTMAKTVGKKATTPGRTRKQGTTKAHGTSAVTKKAAMATSGRGKRMKKKSGVSLRVMTVKVSRAGMHLLVPDVEVHDATTIAFVFDRSLSGAVFLDPNGSVPGFSWNTPKPASGEFDAPTRGIGGKSILLADHFVTKEKKWGFTLAAFKSGAGLCTQNSPVIINKGK